MPNHHGTLTDADVAGTIERALGMFERRWIEQGIREAATDADALDIINQRLGVCGWSDTDGLHVESEPGRRRFRAEVWKRVGLEPQRAGFVTYAEVVDHVRHGPPAVQGALF